MKNHLTNLHMDLMARMNAAEPGSEMCLKLGDLIMATNMLSMQVAKLEEQEEARAARLKAAAIARPAAKTPGEGKRVTW